jgi:hypothetical protein
MGITVHVAESTYVERPCRRSEEGQCPLTNSPPSLFAEALTDYIARNGQRAAIRDAFAREINAHTIPLGSTTMGTTCSGIPLVRLSRAGFNADSTVAILGYSYQIGAGPYPGCGFMAGELAGYRRTPGHRWTRWKVLLSWIT